MKLIIKEYLASLRERGELDAILPDLLSQVGMNVFSRPGRGTRQDGVDVAAVGKLDGKVPKVYLFAIKPGNLTRKDWAGGEVQDLRPSLLEILDAYIPNRLPAEHRDKEIVICLCIGGDIDEQVSPQIEGFVKQHEKSNVTFQQWNGDKLASLIQKHFLREDLLPPDARSHLRKSIAMLDEPETSYKHFSALVRSLAAIEERKDAQRVRAIRQISICLWILLVWGREAGNVESPYRSSELALLHAWRILRLYVGKRSKAAHAIAAAFHSILHAHEQVSTEYLLKSVLPHAGKRDGLSSAVRASCSLDINLAAFDLLGRTAMKGLWMYWAASQVDDDQDEQRKGFLEVYRECTWALKAMISSNAALLSPIKDDQAIDISVAVFLLALDGGKRTDIETWLGEMAARAGFAFRTHGNYPCNLHSYSELLEHPKRGDDQYRNEVTAGSILYPTIALWAALFDFDDIHMEIAALKQEHMQHCNFQLWYPDETSEEHIYTNSDGHGAALSNICVDRSKEDLIKQVFDECEHSPHFNELSAVKAGFWPLIVVACRHHRLPLPQHLLRPFQPQAGSSDHDKTAIEAISDGPT